VHIGDGRKFIEQSRDKYDVIILDAFSATSIPYALSTQEFLIAVKDRLTSGGLVCANLWNEVAEYNDMLKTYDSVFPEWLLLRCGDSGNVILLAFPARMNLTPERWTGIAASFNRSYRTGLDLAGMIRRGVVRRPRIAPRAKVLLDAGTTTSTQTMPSRIPVAN
jgi:spermidine synthase